MPKLEVEVDELKQTMSRLRSVHQAEVEGFHVVHEAKVERLRNLHSAEIERKDAFDEVEKVRVQPELQESYISKLPGLYDEQYELGYWVSYAEAEQIACGDPESSSDDASPPNTMEPAEPMGEETWVLPMPTGEGTSEGARVLLVPTGEGTFEAVAAAITQPIIISLPEFPSVVTRSPGPSLP